MSFRKPRTLILYLALAALPAAAAAPVWKPARQAPPLAARAGRAVPVSTVPALRQAMENARSGDTILVADGTCMLEQPLLFEGKQHVTLRSAAGDPTKVTSAYNELRFGRNTDATARMMSALERLERPAG